MAGAGANFNKTVEVGLPPDAVTQNLVAAVSAAPGYTVTSAGTGSVILTRKYIPTWAIVVGVLGLLLFLVGALVFLYRVTETMTITITPTEGGSRVVVSGLASSEMMQRLSAQLNAMPALSSEAHAASPGELSVSATSAVKTCPACAEEVKAAAKVCRFCGHEFEPGAIPSLTS